MARCASCCVDDGRGVAHQGEFVDLVREPNNPYDRNAIRVDNLSHQQVGWFAGCARV